METKTCSACSGDKAEGGYSKTQWGRPGSKRRCRDCIAEGAVAEAAANPQREKKRVAKLKARQNREKQAEEARKQREKEGEERAKRLRRIEDTLRIAGYDCPGERDDDGTSLTLPIQFRSDRPSIIQLPGTYDIVYISTSCTDKDPYCRTTKGDLTLSPLEGGANALQGKVRMHPELTGQIVPFGGNFEFELREKAEWKGGRDYCDIVASANKSNDGFIPLRVTEFPSEEMAESWGGETILTEGTLKVVAQRTAGGFNDWDGCSDNKDRVTFDSVEEAERLVMEDRETFSSRSWICRHLGLPGVVSQMIHDFAVFRPPPAFFFEEGDLWISVYWDEDHRDYCMSTICARRRSPVVI